MYSRGKSKHDITLVGIQGDGGHNHDDRAAGRAAFVTVGGCV